VDRTGRADAIAPALSALADSDALVRAALVRFLARPELLAVEAPARIAALAAAARRDPEPDVRTAALRAIADVDHESALPALDALVDELSGAERALAASLVAGLPRGRERANARLARAASGTESPAVFAALLVPCARAAAD